MGKGHLARLAAPRTWQIDRKSSVFITKPVPGPHGLQSGMPVNVILAPLAAPPAFVVSMVLSLVKLTAVLLTMKVPPAVKYVPFKESAGELPVPVYA